MAKFLVLSITRWKKRQQPGPFCDLIFSGGRPPVFSSLLRRFLKVKCRRIIVERIPAPFVSIYGKATRMVIESYYAPLAEEIVSQFPSGSILDLGTGPGYLPIEITKRAPDVSIIGIDLSRRLIKRAIENAISSGVEQRIWFEPGDASDLSFENESFDLVISTGMLHMLKDPVQVLRECYRVLKKSGKVWIYDPARVSAQIDQKKYWISLTFLEKLLYKAFILFSRINPHHTYSREEVLELILNTGFEVYDLEQDGEEIKVKLQK